MSDKDLEQMIKDNGANVAPRITPDDIKRAIQSEHYFSAADGYAGAASLETEPGADIMPPPELDLLTFCVLILHNGYTVVGKSAVASPENFNEEIGRKVARDDAIDQLWPLMGFALKERLHNDHIQSGISEHLKEETRKEEAEWLEKACEHGETEEAYKARRIVIDVADLDKIPEVIAMNFRAAHKAVENSLSGETTAVPAETAWQDRVRIEHNELALKIQNLKAFMTTDAYKALDKSDAYTLTEQFDAMQTYLEILHDRIERFPKPAQ